MSESNGRAVFLSYASQDAEAARRICETLQAAGIEVWLDQSELVGGDVWDQKIRRQIQTCTLFVPIISANTQSRTEGYFRLEWRLAEQRTHLMAKGRPFLVPIVIDETRDAEAHVPESFLEVQWSRFPGGQCDEKFAGRMQQLLGGEMAPAARGMVPPPLTASPAKVAHGRANRWWLWPALALLVIGLGFAVRPMLKRPAAARTTAAASPADELVAKARALLDDDPLMTRANVVLAEQLSLQAITKDSTNGEAYAAAAWVNFRFLEANYEDTAQRRADLRNYAERARLLAPDSINAELAMTGVLLATNNRPEAVSRLRALADRVPGNLTVLRAYAGAMPWGNGVNWGDDEKSDPAALARLRTFSPLGRAYADSFLANQHWAKGEYVEAERLLEAIFAAGHPVRLTYLLRVLVLTYGWGDLPAARAFISTLPAKLLLEDVFITHVTNVWLYSGDYDNALATLERTQRELLQEAKIQISTALFRGEVLAAAGRPGAAAIQWRSALAWVEKQLAASAGNPLFHLDRTQLLARLGKREEAAAELGLALEITHPAAGTIEWATWSWRYFDFVGDREKTIPRLDRAIARDNGRWPNDYNDLRYDPAFAGLRQDPRVQTILARGAGWLAEMRRSVAPAISAKSIAVLPFTNMSEDKDNAFFADGIHEDILTNLALVREFRVVSRTTVMGYRGTTKPMKQIAAELGVAYVLEGSVKRAGNKVRVTGQLIDARTDAHAWAKAYDRELTDVFAIQSEVSEQIAAALKTALSPEEKKLIERRPTENVAAYDAYAKARQLLQTGSLAGFSNLEPLLKTAVLLDPKFAQAWAELASVHARLHFDGVDRTDARLAQAKAAIDTAVALAPDDPIVIQKLGDYHYYGYRDFSRAAQQYQQLAGLYPNSAPAFGSLAFIHRRQGRWSEALDELRRAVQLEPRNVRYAAALVETTMALRRYDEADGLQRQIVAQAPDALRQVFTLAFNQFLVRGSLKEAEEFLAEADRNPKNRILLQFVRGKIAELKGDLEPQRGFFVALREERKKTSNRDMDWSDDVDFAVVLSLHGDATAARALVEKGLGRGQAEAASKPSAITWGTLAKAHCVLGDKAEALRCAQAARDALPESNDAWDGPEVSLLYARTLVWFGEKDRALAELTRLLRAPNGANVHRIRHDSNWRSLWGDPRFETLLNDPTNNAPLI